MMIEETPTWSGPNKSIFDPFNIHEVTYKTVDTHDIKVAILIPKSVPSGTRPVIVNMHGGFMAMGHALFAPFFALWIQQLAVQNGGIVVSIDYRLLPTARGLLDPLEDLEDFWTWFRGEFAGVLDGLAPGLAPDYGRVLLTGGSAGGWCVLQTALSHPGEVAAIAAAYPLVDIKDEMFVKGPAEGRPTPLRLPLEAMQSEEEALAWVRKERAKEGWTLRAGFELTVSLASLTNYGMLYKELFNPTGCQDPEIEPLERIKAGAKLPKNLWVMTGDDDSTIRVESVRELVGFLREKLPGTEVRYDEAPGQDHGFDLLNPDWEKHAVGSLDWLKEAWLNG